MITGALWKVGPGVRFGLNWNAKCQIEWELKRRIVRRRQAALSFHSSPKWMLFLYTSNRKENHTWYMIQINLLGEGVGWKWKGGQPGVEIAEDCLLKSLVKSRLPIWYWSPSCLVGCHHAKNGPIHRKMADDRPLVITSKVKPFSILDRTRKEEWMVQPAFCIVDTGSCI